jgi:hypothetical protein
MLTPPAKTSRCPSHFVSTSRPLTFSLRPLAVSVLGRPSLPARTIRSPSCVSVKGDGAFEDHSTRFFHVPAPEQSAEQPAKPVSTVTMAL